MSSLPWFSYYVKDFGYAVAHLTAEEEGYYHRLLRLTWTTSQCSLPADITWISRKCLCRSDADIQILTSVLDEFFYIKNKRYYNKRLHEEWVEGTAKHKSRVEAGKRGGLAKALKTNKTKPSNAKAKAKHGSTNHNHNHNNNNSSYINIDFRPNELNKRTKTAALVSKHMTAEELELQLEKFIAYHTEKRTLSNDFNKQYRAWLQNNIQWKLEKGDNINVKYNTNTLKEISDQRRNRRGALLEQLKSTGGLA